MLETTEKNKRIYVVENVITVVKGNQSKKREKKDKLF